MLLRLFLCAALTTITFAQSSNAQSPIPFDSPRWNIHGKSTSREVYEGIPCLSLSQGKASLPDANFKNGRIEFDIRLQKDRYFPGIGFRMQDADNGEIYYLRPHQSGNPDAMQYYPEYNATGGWQIFYGQGFNNAHPLPFDRWLHIKILVDDDRAEVYFDQEEKPVLYINHLDRPIAAGSIELQNDYTPAARYANVSITPMDHCPLQTQRQPPPILPESVIKSWEVSPAFPESAIDSMLQSNFQWQNVQTDERGIVNLGKLSSVSKAHNTFICRIVTNAPTPTTKRLTFGFSDRIKVYCNKKLLYAGNDVFLSRDYRFLGTIGYFDAVFPEFTKGRNEIWMIVSEDYGGWGLQARLENR